MTFGDLRTAVAHELGLAASADGTGAECPDVDNWINQARDRVLMDTGCYVTAESLSISSLTAVTSLNGAITDYQMPTEALEIVGMYLQSGGWNPRLDRVSVPELIERRRLSLPSGSPTQVYALAGADLLMFWPLPASTDVIELYYIPVPTDLAAQTDDPSNATYGGIPKQLHKAIQYWAFAEGASYDDDQSSAQGQRYRDDYDKEIARYRKFLRERGGLRNARAQVNGGKRRRPLHDNSTYYSGGML
jgi:hypothetical protein